VSKKINFILIGAQKSGTTSLSSWLAQHQDIYFPKTTKEVLFFSKDEFYEKGENYLDAYYKECDKEKIVALADMNLMCFPETIDRIKSYNPDVKILALLRNPVERAYSAYCMAKSFGWENSVSFEDAIDQDSKRANGTYAEKCLSHLSHGYYADQLLPWIEEFGEENVKVIFTDDLKKDPESIFKDVLGFLDVNVEDSNIDVSKNENQAFRIKYKFLVHALLDFDATWHKTIRKMLPVFIRRWISENITKRILKRAKVPASHPNINTETYNKLVDVYYPHNKKLEQVLGRKLDAWNIKK